MLSKLKHYFQDYTRTFYRGEPSFDENIALKAGHSIRVARLCADIAREDGFSAEDQSLAQAAGLLHDIGRFEQYRRFQTFSDHLSIDHGALGAEILTHQLPHDWIPRDLLSLVINVTRYHNAASLPKDQDLRTIKFLRLVRDADKIDIFRLSCNYYRQRTDQNKNSALELNTCDNEEISDAIYGRIMSGLPALKQDIRTLNDFKALQMSWIFDINHEKSFEIIARGQYLDGILSSFRAENRRAHEIYHKTAQTLSHHFCCLSRCALV